jgi:hypothetical protein
MVQPTQTTTKWSDDDFLNTLRGLGDAQADACIEALPPDESLEFAFSKMRADTELPAELPAAFVEYLNAPGGHDVSDLTQADWERLRRGQRVFLSNALPMTLALLAKSLPEGYQARRLSKVLMISGELTTSTYRRVLGVLQMLVNINAPGSFEHKPVAGEEKPTGHGHTEAALTALRVRLMHAGIRKLSKKTFPYFGPKLGGIPVSLEDMMYTIIAFSLHVVQGLELLHVPLTTDEREDYYFVWKVFARCMGIHPPGAPLSWEFIPANLTEAEEFNRSYGRRHFKPLSENPEGALLANAQAKMMAQQLTGGLLRKLAPTLVPRIYIERMLGRDACLNVGIRPVRFVIVTKWLVLGLPRVWSGFWRMFDKIAGRDTTHIDLSRIFFQRLIVGQYDGAPTLRVATRPEEVQDMVQGTRPGLEYGRQQFRQSVFPTELVDIRKRRETLKLDTSALKGPPSTGLGLVGLSLSGGGIRSASFSLGAVQALASRKMLRRMDYMSTVSGGGYIGAALSSVFTDPDAALDGRTFPFNYQPGNEEPPAVRHVRNGSNYLAGGSMLNGIRLPTIIMRGFIINGVLFLPYLMFAALLTWVFYPLAHDARLGPVLFLGALIAFVGLMLSYPAVSWLFGRKFTWAQRDRYENVQAMSLALFAMVLVFGLLSGPVEAALTSDWTTAFTWLRSEVAKPVESRDAWKWGLLVITAVSLVSVGKVSRALTRRSNQLFILVLGALGPATVFGAYLLLLVGFARSPLLSASQEVTIEALADQTNTAPPSTLPAANAPPSSTRFATARDSARHARAVADSVLRRVAARDSARAVLYADLSIRGIDIDSTKPIVTSRAGYKWIVTDTSGEQHDITLDDDVLEISGVEFGTEPEDWLFALLALSVFVLNGLWVDVNVSSAHGFYRDRLSRAFLFRARWYGPIVPNDAQLLSALGAVNPVGPYHLINTALNLNGEQLSDLPGRRSDFFLFSKRFVGSYATGYCDTTAIEEADRRLNLGTAMAVSGAAAAPNSGTTTVRPLTFILTLLNVRLGYWVPNPWYVQADSLVRRLRLRQRPGPNYLLREGLGMLNARTSFVNISDGGHIENLGIYELLRRRCSVIVAIDAEADPTMSCPSLAKLIRYARTDLGLEIHIDLKAIQHTTDGGTDAHWAVGTIYYGTDEKGYLLYVKSSVTGDEPPYVRDYKRRSPAFPNESTADQFFDEAQFESYRALGYHAMNNALKAIVGAGADGTPIAEEIAALRRALGIEDSIRRASISIQGNQVPS